MTLLKQSVSYRMSYKLFSSYTSLQKSQDNSVGIAMGYGMDGWGSICGRGKIFLFSIVFRLAVGPTQPPVQWAQGGCSLGVEW
jgi:hypothetical protein